MIMILVKGEPIVIGNRGKGWEIQVQPVAVQSKLEKDAEGSGDRRGLYIPCIRPPS
jgi:hypothetical protein